MTADSGINLDALTRSAVERLVAVEAADDGTVALFRRGEDGSLCAEETEFQPVLLLADGSLAEGLADVCEVRTLNGPGTFNTMVRLVDWNAYEQAVKDLNKATGLTPSKPGALHRVFNDREQQFLSLHPARLFRGMAFQELRRLQLDIETLTTPGFDFPNAEREGDEIIIISLRDSTGWEQCLSGPEMSEKAMLAEMVRLIRERDPDVIEGHNIFEFDLPYIQTRCRRHRVKLALGRDGSNARYRSSRFTAGEYTSTYRRYAVYGRHVVDTLHLARLYDVSHRDLESYSLKSVARHFGVSAPQRTYVAGGDISAVYRSDPERLRAYAMDDVRETEAIGRLMSPSFFYQAQLVPFSYQNCISRGTAARIDAMLIAAYLHAGESLPVPGMARPFAGGLTDSPGCGVYHNVWHVDVRSLYPSIIISNRLIPSTDSLRVYGSYLDALRRFRLAAKDAARSAPTPEERDHFDALQGTLKILINSFYGYVGFQQATFNDFDMAETVTATGREIMGTMLSFLSKCGATVLELDTDGIYFVPPADITEPAEMEARVQSVLPPGIEVELDATYKAMFAYKSKNYALLDDEGRTAVTGAALKSRGLEPFQRKYIHDFISSVLAGNAGAVDDLVDEYRRGIEDHEIPVADLAKSEVLSTPPAVYAEKLAAGKTRRSAAYELVLASGRDYKQGDRVTFYVTGAKKNVSVSDAARLLCDADPGSRDENVPYYVDKLVKLHGKLSAALA